MTNLDITSSTQNPESDESESKFNKNDFTIFMNDLSGEFKDGMQEFYVLGNSLKNWFIKVGNWFSNLSLKSRQFKISKKTLNRTEKVEKKLKKIEESLQKTMQLTQEIKADTSKIALDLDFVIQILDYQMERVEDVEAYMKENLGSNWLQVKNCWREYKNGDIPRKEFTKIALKKLGKTFLGIFVNTSL